MNESVRKKEKSKNLYLDLKNYYYSEKYDSFLKLVDDYLTIECDENSLQKIRFMKAKILRKKGMFEEAIIELEKNIKKCRSDYNLIELFFDYYSAKRYKEAKNLLPVLYSADNKKSKRLINHYSLSIAELVICSALGETIYVKKDQTGYYIKLQIVNYKEEMAIQRILDTHFSNESLDDFEMIEKHFPTSSSEENMNKSYFSTKIDFNKLYNIVKEKIECSKKSTEEEFMDVYYFSASNIGYTKNTFTNIFKVVVVPNTKNILTMYPVLGFGDSIINMLDIDMSLILKDKPKEKTYSRISRIDRFNGRLEKTIKR